MFANLNQTWDLEVFFPGGSASPQFTAYLDGLAAEVRGLAAQFSGLGSVDVGAWSKGLDAVQVAANRLRQAAAFVSCLTAQNVDDKQARLVSGRVRQIQAAYASVLTMVDERILTVPDDEWAGLLRDERLQPLAFVLDERRRRARDLMSPPEETLVNDLSIDGYHGWSDLYDLATGRMAIAIEDKGQTMRLSPGQLANRMSDPHAETRAALMTKWEDAWAGEAEFCALTLNHLAGYRLNLYSHRGWNSVLHEPLDINRMSGATLDAMWKAIEDSKDRLVTYLQRKSRVLGVDRLGWQDVDAPLGSSGSKLGYDQAADFIVQHFREFSPRLADLASRAFRDRWIEAEDRPGKRMGGFCTSFPSGRQSRVFVTFSGTMGNLATLAHELGHAYHQHLMNDLPPFIQQYAMNVAETASTFAELIVSDAAVRSSRDRAERLNLIEDRLRRAATLLMNIQCRFLFETRFYEERAKGMVSVPRLNELMVTAQKEAFRDALGLYHPHFWASKLHFYNTRVPFYNFPYTFGFLFSAGVYARAIAEGPSFESRYAELLRDTGRMTVEDLALRHLGADLTSTGFWQRAVDLVLGDLDEFLKLTS